MVCTLADAPGAKANAKSLLPRARLFASYAYTSTTILFGGDRRADLTRHAGFVGTEVPVMRRLGLRFGAGGLGGGELVLGDGRRADLGPGVSAFFGAVATIVDEKPDVPFVQLGATLSMSRAATRGPGPTEGPSFTAFDLRAAATVGKTMFRMLVPFVTLRAFGGPIYYRIDNDSVRGTDLYKYQVAGGLAFSLPSRLFDVFVEGVPLGESGLSADLSTTFD